MIRALLMLVAPAAILAALPAAAQVRPQPGSGDPRVQTVEYNAEQVVQLRAAPGYQITVELGADEHIENVAVGDAGAWQVSANKRGDHLFVKPLQTGVTTNMTVVTDVRVYAFELAPLFAAQPDMAYTVRFTYPAPPGAAQANAEAAKPAERGRYRLSGSRAVRPTGIDDDGSKTYIEWPADKPLPAVYALGERGQELLVNGQMRDGIYVIDRVVGKLVFRLDRQRAYATRVGTAEKK